MNIWIAIPAGYIVAGLWIATSGTGGLFIGGVPIAIGLGLQLAWLCWRELRRIADRLEANAFPHNASSRTVKRSSVGYVESGHD